MRTPPPIRVGLLLAGLVSAVAARAAQNETMEYDISWVGISVGTMMVRSETDPHGTMVRSIRVWNRPWIALVYPVDTTIESTVEQTPDGPRYTVLKKVSERNFVQNDVLVVRPDAGKAVWSNAVSNVVHSFDVPRGSKDLVTLFFDLREAAGEGNLEAGGEFQLVMDDALHTFEIQVAPMKSIRTPYGRMHAIPVKAVSKSAALFSRNTPRSIWVCWSMISEIQTS